MADTASVEEETPALRVQRLADIDGPFESPIDLNIGRMTAIELPPLEWINYELEPRKIKATNTGHTLIVSAKWHVERPYLQGGPLGSKYVFSQLHFHWGRTCMEGSEHTVDGRQMPMEMHVVHFKSSYLTQESALREKDGVILLAYLFKLQAADNPCLEGILQALASCREPHSSSKLQVQPLSRLLTTFTADYCLYWGSVMTSTCAHLILWFVCRDPIGISVEQIELFHKLLDVNNDPLVQNFRPVRPVYNRTVFHVNPSGYKNATLKILEERA